METIKVKTLRATDSFITHMFTDFPSDEFPDYFIPSFEKYYFGHSGNKMLGGMAVSELDEYSIADDEGNLVEVDDGCDETGVIDEFSSWYEDIGKALGDMHYGKWHSVFASLQKAYGKDFYDLDSTEETLTNALKDSKEYSHSKNTKTSSSITTTETPDLTTETTDSVSAFNATDFSDSDKSVSKESGTNTTTSVGSSDDNHSDTSDTGTDTTDHTGTRTRSIRRTGGNDVWKRAEEYNRYVSVNLFREMANDIDKVITLPFYM